MIIRVDFKFVESPPYMRGRRIPIVVVGVVSPSFPCASQFGVMHPGTKEELPSLTVTNVREESVREGIHHI